MYYPTTIAAIRAAIEQEAPGTTALFVTLEPKTVSPFSYLLWMCDYVATMDASLAADASKAARWVGWMLAHVEFHGLWNNARSRDLVREDKEKGFDAPHR